MKTLYALPLLALPFTALLQQSQPEPVDDAAKAILDRVKAKYDAYSTMTINFEQHIMPSEGQKQVINAKLYIKGDKFRLEYPDQWIICNTETYWIVLLDTNGLPTEATASTYDDASEDVIQPSDVFRLYEKDFKFAMNDPPIGEKKMADGSVQKYDIIRFAPLSHEVFYHTIKLYVSQADQSIERAIVIDKEQNQLMFKIKSLIPNTTISDTRFTFDHTKYPKIVFNDLRD